MPGPASIAGDGFEHRVDLQGAVRAAPRLHVYLEGDGRPFATRHVPAQDPTPRRRLARELMTLDPAPALYLGRPCYDGQASAPGCTTTLWTGARYGEAVVRSMAAALTRLRGTHGFDEVTLIGYSGGGTLAMLLAERLPYVTRVVTVAGNLDLDAWAALHRYTPLSTSLNPARRPPLRPTIGQWHYAGDADAVVPPALLRAALGEHGNTRGNTRIRVLPGVAHADGWRDRWPALLAEFAASPVP